MAEQYGKALVPQIRFAGFTDPWEQRKLGDVATIVGGGTPSTNNDAYWDGDIDWYSPAELGEQVYADRSVRRITQAGYDSCSATLLPAGKTILFTSRAGIGNTAILRRSACTNQGFQSLVVNDDTDVYFIYSMTDRIKNFAEQKASGSTFLEISGKGLAAGEFAFPSKDEQTAIGSMFKQLDHLITLHQRKYDKLCVLKKSMLDKMFPKGGSLYPEIRFAGFTDPWEQRKLGELIQLGGSGGTPSATNPSYYGGEIPFLSIADIEGRDITHTAKTLTEEGLKNSAAWIVPAGAVSLAMYASVGKVGIIRQNTATSQAFYNMVFDNAAIRDFVFTRLEKADMDSEWEPYISTGTQRNLNADKVKAFALLIPEVNEAANISRYFRQLDSLITLHQRKLELLRNIKKSMLDKMFV